MPKPDEIIKTAREELGAVQSCALLMAHAQSADARVRYLKTVGEKIQAIDSLLEKLRQAAGAADTPTP
jgi:hypothetical protein